MKKSKIGNKENWTTASFLEEKQHCREELEKQYNYHAEKDWVL